MFDDKQFFLFYLFILWMCDASVRPIDKLLFQANLLLLISIVRAVVVRLVTQASLSTQQLQVAGQPGNFLLYLLFLQM